MPQSGRKKAADLITPQLYSPLYLLIVEGEGLVTSCLSLSRLSLNTKPWTRMKIEQSRLRATVAALNATLSFYQTEVTSTISRICAFR